MKRKWLLFAGACAVSVCLFAALLVWNGLILLNNPSKEMYPVRGVDVSAWQGEIDWKVLASQDISFAYIKATEGSTFVDERFAHNFEQAGKTGLRVGAYHFFSYDSGGDTQAQNFIANVPIMEDMLPPVIDLEFYADKEKNPPEREQVARELTVFLDKIEAHYGMKPVIYATEKSYALYLEGEYAAYDIWIRGVYAAPILSDGRQWTFWQYTNRAYLKGCSGEEVFIDMNVFRGTAEEFAEYPGKNA